MLFYAKRVNSIDDSNVGMMMDEEDMNDLIMSLDSSVMHLNRYPSVLQSKERMNLFGALNTKSKAK